MHRNKPNITYLLTGDVKSKGINRDDIELILQELFAFSPGKENHKQAVVENPIWCIV